jgi:stage II sporulation protein Q
MKPEEPNKISSFEKAKFRSRWKKWFAKKWFFPAVYVTVAALILTLAWWYQESQLKEVSRTSTSVEPILPVESVPTPPADEQMILPTADHSDAGKTMGFYEESGSTKSKEKSLVKYANTFWPHSGMDFARKDGKTFDVVAALSGKVVRVEENPIVGMQVEIAHDNGLTTVYQSLDDVRVKVGQTVKKGDVIARAGRNTFEKEEGIHLHFEVRNKDQQSVNPAQYLPGGN